MDEMTVHAEVTPEFIKSFTQNVLSDDLTRFVGELEEMKKVEERDEGEDQGCDRRHDRYQTCAAKHHPKE